MDARLLPQTEFDSVHFFRAITLAILLVISGMAVAGVADGEIGLISALPLVIQALAIRFALEWRRVTRCMPAFIHDDELVLCGVGSHRRIELSKVSSVRSRHSIFMVRRYRSWSEHVAFLEVTLNDGERVHTLAESAVLECPPAKHAVKAIEAAVLSAKMRDIAKRQQGASDNR